MNKEPIRRLKSSEVECRVSTSGVKADGTPYATYLLYKDARVDMRILDEHFGPMNWQREHMLIGDRLYCTISIYDEEKRIWIKKQDVGTESNAEPEKGQASDAFKRAGFNVGIGRELYTAPYISVDLKDGEYSSYEDPKTKKPKITPKLNLYVKEIDYDEQGNINLLMLKDRKNVIRYSLGKTEEKVQSKAQQSQGTSTSLSNPQTDKPVMHQGHDSWLPILQSILSGAYTLEQYKKKYFFPEADEIAAKDWLLRHQS